MMEKYALELTQSSKNFLYLGKMSTESMLNMLKDDQLEDIAEFMAKKYGLDISSYSKIDKAVTKFIEDAFDMIHNMSQGEKSYLKDIANGVVKPSKFNTTKLMDKVKNNSKITSHYSKWIDDMKDAAGMRGKKQEAWINYMKQMEQDIKKNMSSDAISAIKMYSGNYYCSINAWLRSGGKLADAEEFGVHEELAKKVNKLISEWNKDSIKTTEDYILRRGTDLGDLAGLFMKGDFFANESSLAGKSVEELASMFVGQVGEYKGFTSTSSMYNKGFSGDVECIILLPKGSSGMSILSTSRFGDAEGEFLLNAGTKVVCKGIEKSDGNMASKIRVFLEVLV